MAAADLPSRLVQIESQLRDPTSAPSKALKQAAVLHRLGAALVVLGCLGFVCSFAWITATLAIAAGATLVRNFGSPSTVKHLLATRFAVTDCCCHPFHLQNLAIALMVSAVMSSSYSISLTGQWAGKFLSSSPLDCTTTTRTNSGSTQQVCKPYSETLPASKYLAVAFIGGIVVSLLSMMCAFLLFRRIREFEKDAGVSIRGAQQIGQVFMNTVNINQQQGQQFVVGGGGGGANPFVIVTSQQFQQFYPQQQQLFTNPYAHHQTAAAAAAGGGGMMTMPMSTVPMAIPVSNPAATATYPYPQPQPMQPMHGGGFAYPATSPGPVSPQRGAEMAYSPPPPYSPQPPFAAVGKSV